MRPDNEDPASGFLKNPFADASNKKLIHRASPMRSCNNHIYIHLRGLLKNCVYRCALHKKGCFIKACLAQSLFNLLNLAMFALEFFRKAISGRLWIHFKFNEAWLRLRIMQDPHLC